MIARNLIFPAFISPNGIGVKIFNMNKYLLELHKDHEFN